jgi:conjugative transfer pilus assembly protein TraH
MRGKTGIGVMVLFLLFGIARYSEAGWVDDWVNQSVVSGQSSFATQKRNYATFGGANLRWQTHSDPLVSISKPRFKAGCGGIDAYMGGFSFMQFEYLVQKLQRIMGPAAAGFAFDIALNTLCEQCSKSIKSFEAIIDRLNALQLDDCKASKVVATTIVDGFKNPGKRSSEATEAWTDFAQSTGAEDLWTSMKDFAGNKKAEAVKDKIGANTADVYSSCPQLIKDVFFTNGSLLEHLGNKRSYPEAYIKLLRGLLGDIDIQNNVNQYPMSLCYNNTDITEIADKIYNGKVEIEDAGGNCQPMGNIVVNGATYNNYKSYVTSMLTNIAQKMINKQALSSAEENFIINVQGDVYTGIKAYAMNMGNDAQAAEVASLFEPVAGRYYIYAMFRDFYKYASDLLNYADQIKGRQPGAAGTGDESHCQVKFLNSTYEYLTQMKDTANKYMRYAYDGYVGKTSILAQQQNVSETISSAQRKGQRLIGDIIK